MRHLGVAGFLSFVLTGPGIVISAMIYPIYLATVAMMLVDPLDLWSNGGALHAAAMGLYLFNLIAGYGAIAALAVPALSRRGRPHAACGIALLPLYWLLMSAVAYRAVVELVVRPHHWAKTPHRPHRRGRAARAGDAVPALKPAGPLAAVGS